MGQTQHGGDAAEAGHFITTQGLVEVVFHGGLTIRCGYRQFILMSDRPGKNPL